MDNITRANIAEYAAMYGIPFDAAVGVYVLAGMRHIRQHITGQVVNRSILKL